MQFEVLIPLVLLCCGASFFLGWYLNAKIGQGKIAAAKDAASKIVADAAKEADTVKREKLLEVKDEWYQKKKEFDTDVQNKRSKLQAQEKALEVREENIDRKVELLGKKEREQANIRKTMDERTRTLDARQVELDRMVQEENIRLERASGLSRDEARRTLVENLVNEARSEAAVQLKEIRDKTRDDARREAQKLIVQAIQRTAADHSVETTVSVLNIQSDEMKGRIIGREGRNIRAFESATGVDVIVDDTPEAVILSAFDPFRREVARIALERLIADGRIHPARIEEVVDKVRTELEEELVKTGENTLLELGLHGGHREMIRLLGRMKYRSSYGQNMLQHSTEVAFLSGLMASELHLDANLAKRAGLFHDIGKCADPSIEGPHALLGYEIAKKYGEHPLVSNAIGAHHDDIPMESPLAPLVQAADAISGARPGARRESVEGYVKRLEKLEAFAQSFQGVAKTYAIQAGREVRVVVEQDRVDDAKADQLAHDISAKIQAEMEYPGQIKVTVIREYRAVSYAK
jgi:ribonucrease Y